MAEYLPASPGFCHCKGTYFLSGCHRRNELVNLFLCTILWNIRHYDITVHWKARARAVCVASVENKRQENIPNRWINRKIQTGMAVWWFSSIDWGRGGSGGVGRRKDGKIVYGLPRVHCDIPVNVNEGLLVPSRRQNFSWYLWFQPLENKDTLDKFLKIEGA